MTSFRPLPFVIDAYAAEIGKRVTHTWDLQKYPHALVIGGTGSGKTYAISLILGKASLHIPGIKITVCDFKGGGDFGFLAGCDRYHTFADCYEGLGSFYKELETRQAGNKERGVQILCFDELAAFITHLDKKKAEDAKQMIANIAMLGRSFNLHLLVGVQRPDAEYFGKARDNFSLILALGNISSEAKQMFFSSDLRDQMLPCCRGEGHLLLNGSEMHRVIVPSVGNIPYLHKIIRRSVK
jgi:hypothetical protein